MRASRSPSGTGRGRGNSRPSIGSQSAPDQGSNQRISVSAVIASAAGASAAK
ncbi:MAG: hypothetical protein QUV04_10705 [Synechococcus sp. WH 8007]|nr:hypothetical protein [Synechococcus sp. WH 8007]